MVGKVNINGRAEIGAMMGQDESLTRCLGKSPCVAVIVPFYNASDTLPQLVEALKAQTHRDFVALFVDDGSTDCGRGYIDGVARADSRFRVLESERHGPGGTRNTGLDMVEAVGFEYVTFVDADDLPMPTMLSESLAMLDSSGADIVHYQWNSSIDGRPHKDSMDGSPSIYVWNKLYRASAIAGIRFFDIKFAEDLAFFLETEARRPKRVEIVKPLYCHICHKGSLWESRTPPDIAYAMRTVICKLNPIIDASFPSLRRQWNGFYKVKLLKIWRKSLRGNLRAKRDIAVDDYIDFVSTVRLQGFFAMRFRIRHALFVLGVMAKRFGASISEVHGMRLVRRRYDRVRRRIMSSPPDRRIRILFHVTDVSKWKCQTVYERLGDSGRFEPFVLIDLAKPEYGLEVDARNAIYLERRNWFSNRGIACKDGYDVLYGKENDISAYAPDIVFYQQPWGIRDSMSIGNVSRYALTCYIPYYVPNYSEQSLEYGSVFHRSLAYYMVMSNSLAESYRSGMNGIPHVCEFIVTGHPAIDTVLQRSDRGGRPDGTVIYAPHWTFHSRSRSTACCYGTFEWSGEVVLDFAERHPEIHWCFKPHPLLKESLVASGLYDRDWVEAYYRRWEQVGQVCTDADYYSVFQRSAAMITDCGSFLTEYSVTGKPIVHLLSSYNSLSPVEGLGELYGTFYGVRDGRGLLNVLDGLILRGSDPKAGVRTAALDRSGIVDGQSSSERVLDFLERVLSRSGG